MHNFSSSRARLFFILLDAQHKFIVYYWTITLAHVLLVNFKAYDDRFFLFLAPFFGACVGESCRRIIDVAKTQLTKKKLLKTFILFEIIANFNAYKITLKPVR